MSAFKIQLIIRLLIILVSQISDLYFRLLRFHKDTIFLRVEESSLRSIELSHRKLCSSLFSFCEYFFSVNSLKQIKRHAVPDVPIPAARSIEEVIMPSQQSIKNLLIEMSKGQ